ncbi:MAG: 1-phosphofructokinase [Clostridia bacterium]|nr:1-phosphofructokinase [Clostridia bacterium]
MIYTLTLNPSIDYIIGVDNIEYGRVNRTSYEKILPGGKGINVSIVLNNLGVCSCALGFVGGFTGEYIKNALEESGVETDFVLLEKGVSRINTKIKSNEETEINAAGPEITDSEKAELMSKIKNIKDNDILVLAGSVPKGLGKDFYSEIMEVLKEKDVKIVVDAEGDLLKNTLKHRPFLIKPNNFELEGFFGVKINTLDETVKYAKELQKIGARNIFVSMGGDGGIFVCEDGNAFYSEAPKGRVINTTGSGDSAVAGFIFEYEKSNNFKDAFIMGISAGSASAFSENLAKKDEICDVFRKLTDKCEVLK